MLAERLNIDPGQMIEAIKSEVFGREAHKASNSDLAVACQIAFNLGLNPMMPGMLDAFNTQGGLLKVIIGPDGIFQLLATHRDIDRHETELHYDDKGKLLAATCTIHRVSKGPIKKTVYLEEWMVPSNPNWKTRPRHMLELRAIKQCARLVIHGIPLDREEAIIAEYEEVRSSPVQGHIEAPVRETNSDRLAGFVADANIPKPEEEPKREPKKQPSKKKSAPPKEEPKPEPKPEPEAKPKEDDGLPWEAKGQGDADEDAATVAGLPPEDKEPIVEEEEQEQEQPSAESYAGPRKPPNPSSNLQVKAEYLRDSARKLAVAADLSPSEAYKELYPEAETPDYFKEYVEGAELEKRRHLMDDLVVETPSRFHDYMTSQKD